MDERLERYIGKEGRWRSLATISLVGKKGQVSMRGDTRRRLLDPTGHSFEFNRSSMLRGRTRWAILSVVAHLNFEIAVPCRSTSGEFGTGT